MSLSHSIKPIKAHVWTREEHEHYVEPEWCSRRLFEVEHFPGPIWDPACGFGRICEAAKAAGMPTIATDIVNRGYGSVADFFASSYRSPSIVTNPPFDIFEAFARRALLMAVEKVAMLFPVRRLNAAHWLLSTPLLRIWLLTPRPSMPPGHVIATGEKPGGGTVDYCWLVWQKSGEYIGTMNWLHRDA